MSNAITISHIKFSTSCLEQIVALHRVNAHTLGFFPRGAFEDYARSKRIIVATDSDGNCCGYLLYRVARGRVSIVHLCVGEKARGKGVASSLVKELKRATQTFEGIGLYCRRDYDATHLWSKFGFEAVNAKTGRGRDRAELIFWWFSHGHKDLFSRVAEAPPLRQRVVIDTNVFYDLHCRNTPESEDSKALLAPWVQASIELVVTKELRNEITKGDSEEGRRQNRAHATLYNTLLAQDSEFQRLCSELRPLFPESTTLRDDADLRQVAYAVAGGATFLVTRDEALTDRCEPLYKSHGLMVFHPAELIKHLDAVEREGDYRPARIEGTRLKKAPLTPESLDSSVARFKLPTEREGELRRAILHAFSHPKIFDVQAITDQTNAAVLLAVMNREQQNVLNVPVLRRGKHPMTSTILRNFLRACLVAAADEGRSTVTITETRLGESSNDVLPEFGFVKCRDASVKLALRLVGDLPTVQAALRALKLDPSSEAAREPALSSMMEASMLGGPAAVAAIERRLWPAKIIGQGLPSFIVSIQPQWAQHFFDVQLGSQLLFGLRDDLHLGVEGVYYRRPENNNLQVPGRILWYVSKGSGDGAMAIKACSQLEEIILGKPKSVFRRFQRLGVYEWRDIYAASKQNIHNDIIAFRFRMTERFKVPVDKDGLEKLGIKGPFMSPRKVTEAQFASIYKAGFSLA